MTDPFSPAASAFLAFGCAAVVVAVVAALIDWMEDD